MSTFINRQQHAVVMALSLVSKQTYSKHTGVCAGYPHLLILPSSPTSLCGGSTGVALTMSTVCLGSTRDASGGAEAPHDSEAALLSQEEYLLVTNRLHQVLRPFVLRRLKDSVAKELPDKVRAGL